MRWLVRKRAGKLLADERSSDESEGQGGVRCKMHVHKEKPPVQMQVRLTLRCSFRLSPGRKGRPLVSHPTPQAAKDVSQVSLLFNTVQGRQTSLPQPSVLRLFAGGIRVVGKGRGGRLPCSF